LSEARIAAAWRAVYDTPDGRQAIGHLLVELNLYSEIIPQTELQAGILLGQRNVACRIAKWIGRKPERAISDVREDVDIIDRMLMQGD
jgi:hypothetical protein